MKKLILISVVILSLSFIFQITTQSVVEAAHYFIHSRYFDEGEYSVKETMYIDSENIGIYSAGGKFTINKSCDKGGLFRVREIKVQDYQRASNKSRQLSSQAPPKQKILKKDYYFFRKDKINSISLRPYSVFNDDMVSYILENNIPGNIIGESTVSGLYCLEPRLNKDGSYTFINKLVKAKDGSNSDWYLLKVYEEAIKIYGFKDKFITKAERFVRTVMGVVQFTDFDNVYSKVYLDTESIKGNKNDFQCIVKYIFFRINSSEVSHTEYVKFRFLRNFEYPDTSPLGLSYTVSGVEGMNSYIVINHYKNYLMNGGVNHDGGLSLFSVYNNARKYLE